MANQIIIDIGAVANDGTGDPLRTAFGYVNNNFSNIWTTGVANSNIQFDGNRILTTNTNGNLVLAPNGIGKVQANVDIVPNANNTLSLGSLTRQWNTVYAQNLAVGGNVEFNDLTVDGNLTVTGNTIQIGSASNAWTTNIGLAVIGNLSVTGTVNASNVFANLATANNISFIQDLFGKTGTFTGDTRGDNSIYAGVPLFTSLGSDVVAQFSGNVDAYTQFNFQNGNAGPQASGDYVITADNGNDITHFVNLGMTGSGWDGSQPNSLGNRLGPNDGYLYVQDGDMVIGTSNGNIETWKFDQTGNLTFPDATVQTTAYPGIISTTYTSNVIANGSYNASAPIIDSNSYNFVLIAGDVATGNLGLLNLANGTVVGQTITIMHRDGNTITNPSNSVSVGFFWYGIYYEKLLATINTGSTGTWQGNGWLFSQLRIPTS
jgi:hypothetical protein